MKCGVSALKIPFLSKVVAALHNRRFDGRLPVFGTSPNSIEMYLEGYEGFQFQYRVPCQHIFEYSQVFSRQFLSIKVLSSGVQD